MSVEGCKRGVCLTSYLDLKHEGCGLGTEFRNSVADIVMHGLWCEVRLCVLLCEPRTHGARSFACG